MLEPAVQFALYFTVFSYFLGMRLEGKPGVGSFALYLLSGLVPFQFFQECLMRAAGFARSQAGLVRHVNVPLEVLLAGAILATLLRNLLSLALVAAVAIALGSLAWSAVPVTLAGMALLVLGTIGLTLVVVPAGAFIPDLVQVVATSTTVLFFLTPIVYPIRIVPEAARRWIAYNPLLGIVDAVRAGFVRVDLPAWQLAYAAAASLAVLAVGLAVFAWRAPAVRDVV